MYIVIGLLLILLIMVIVSLVNTTHIDEFGNPYDLED